jgi:hypothetical protein
LKRGKCIESLEMDVFCVTEAVRTPNCVKKIALSASGDSRSAAVAIYAGDGEMPMEGGFPDGRRLRARLCVHVAAANRDRQSARARLV